MEDNANGQRSGTAKRAITYIGVFGIVVVVAAFSILVFRNFVNSDDSGGGIRLAEFREYETCWYPGDIVVGDGQQAITYHSYDSETNVATFFDMATGRFIRIIVDDRFVVFDPIRSNLQDRGFYIQNFAFHKLQPGSGDGYFLSGSLYTTWYREGRTNTPEGIQTAYDEGYDRGYLKGLTEIINYDALNSITLKGNGIQMPMNWNIRVSGNTTDIVVEFVKEGTPNLGWGTLPIQVIMDNFFLNFDGTEE